MSHLENIDSSLCSFRVPALGASTIVSVDCQSVFTTTRELGNLPQPAARATRVLANHVLRKPNSDTDIAMRSTLVSILVETVKTPFSTLG